MDDLNDRTLDEYVEKLGVRFSGYVKGLIYQDLLNRAENEPVNPYRASQPTYAADISRVGGIVRTPATDKVESSTENEDKTETIEIDPVDDKVEDDTVIVEDDSVEEDEDNEPQNPNQEELSDAERRQQEQIKQFATRQRRERRKRDK